MAVEFRQATLENGLTLVAEVDDEAHTAACGFYVRTGARDEPAELMGVSHFLEHMMFKGTDRLSAEDVNREFDDFGANYNAFTSHDMTAFWSHSLPEYLPRAVALLAEILRPALRDEDFQTERGVILEEIAMYEDMPFWRLYESVLERYYGSHPLGYRILGTNETIRELQRDQMKAYFDHRYSPDNMVLAMAGRLDFDAVRALAEEACGAWPRTGVHRDYPEVRPNADELVIEDPKTNKNYLLMVSPAPAAQDRRRYAANMLAHLLGDGEGSLLYWALVDPGLAEEAQVGYDARDHAGDFYAYASCPPERAEVVERIVNEQIGSCLNLISEDDLERLRNKIATGVTLAGERPSGRMRRLGRLWTILQDYWSLEEELERIQAVTLEDVREVYQAFPFRPRMVGRLRPGVAAV